MTQRTHAARSPLSIGAIPVKILAIFKNFWPKHDFGANFPGRWGLHKNFKKNKKFSARRRLGPRTAGPKNFSPKFSQIAIPGRISFRRARMCTSMIPTKWHQHGFGNIPGWGEKSILSFGFLRRAVENQNLNRCFLRNGSELGDYAFTAPHRFAKIRQNLKNIEKN